MLRKETVSESTLELLKVLICDDRLQKFFLVGGTALSLQIGHRISIDLDFFCVDVFDDVELLGYLERTYKFQLDYQGKYALKGQINDVKVDFIAHDYPLVNSLFVDDGVRMAAPEDIAAMKLNAIAGNGTRVKDFIDIAYLSSIISLSQMLEAYSVKYSSRNPLTVVKSLEYHHDINFAEPIEMVAGKFVWKNIETRLKQILQQPEKLFGAL